MDFDTNFLMKRVQVVTTHWNANFTLLPHFNIKYKTLQGFNVSELNMVLMGKGANPSLPPSCNFLKRKPCSMAKSTNTIDIREGGCSLFVYYHLLFMIYVCLQIIRSTNNADPQYFLAKEMLSLTNAINPDSMTAL